MLKVTKKASEMVKESLKNQKEPLVIRIFMQNGCCGSSLGMALDELKESDFTLTDNGIQYVIDKDLLNEVKPVKVDFADAVGGSGFRLTSNLSNRPGAGAGCCG